MAAAEEGHAGVAWLVLRAALRAVGVDGLREVATGPDGLDALRTAAVHGHRPAFNLLARWLPEDGFIVPYPKDQSPPGRDFGDGAMIDRLVSAPAFGTLAKVFAKAAGAITFELGGLEAEDFERVDVVHLAEDAISRRMTELKERRGPTPEAEAVQPEAEEVDDEDLPF